MSDKVLMPAFGENDNAYDILAKFKRYGKDQGVSLDLLNKVINDAKSGSFEQLKQTIKDHCVFIK